MRLVVAEKPSVARDIARVLGCARREGYFESSADRVTWAVGHLVTLKEPDELDPKYKRWRAEDLPIIPERFETKVLPNTRAQFQTIRKLMLDPSTQRIVCATDAGREGELIFRLIYEEAGCRKPVDRLWISSLTDAAIREGFEALKPSEEYDGLYQSALCRAQADWLVGMNASRAFTLKYGALLSVGRVQTPTLAILVQRAKEIRAFVPETYHTVTADFGDYKGQWFDPKKEEDRASHRIAGKEEAEAIAAAVRGREAKVRKAETTAKKELPPQLFDLTSLQREANRRLGFTADRTLKTAQALYESRKCITYPRTDSRFLPYGMLPGVNKALSSLPEAYQGYVRGVPRRDGKLSASSRLFDDAKVTDHHAIIPTPVRADPAAFTPEERALYDLVVRRFIAAFYPAFEYDQTNVVTQAAGHSFRSSGRVVRSLGWKAVMGEGEKDKDDEAALPALAVGDTRKVVQATVRQETTKPPAPHTDASLLSRMEHPETDKDEDELMQALKKAGLGTPATRAAVIERLIQVGYASRRGKAITATEKGELLIEAVPDEIASPVMTAKWEQALEEIAHAGRAPARFMEGIRRFTSFLTDYAQHQAKPLSFPAEMRTKSGKVKAFNAPKALEGMKCPLCGKPVQESDRAFGCAAWKEGCRFTLWKNAFARQKGPMLNEAIVRRLLEGVEVRGSTGTLIIADGELRYTPAGEGQPRAVPLRYEAAQKPAAPAPGKRAAGPRRAAKPVAQGAAQARKAPAKRAPKPKPGTPD
ncbi:MAG TPA: DNA topoisomerase III [Candidatus Limnocylindria bacterium]|nr:DNA topoisomerase III [Candidatus Limnocylindria bacterium]